MSREPPDFLGCTGFACVELRRMRDLVAVLGGFWPAAQDKRAQ